MTPLDRLPNPGDRRVAVRVTDDALRWIRGGHPWLYEASITHEGDGAPGDLAVVFDRKRRFRAIGLYDPTSVIRVRVLHHGDPVTIDEAWWARRLDEVLERRRDLLDDPDTTGLRLVNGENDGLPGLVVDLFDATAVVKIYTPAWYPNLRTFLPLLQERVELERVVLRLARNTERALPAAFPDVFPEDDRDASADAPVLETGDDAPADARGEGAEPSESAASADAPMARTTDDAPADAPIDGTTLIGAPPTEPVLFRENGLVVEADVVHGQKTGYFLDQRDNRRRVRDRSRGARVLDVFSAGGGFTLAAAAGGARSVLSVDISGPALDATRRNLDHNRHLDAVRTCRHEVHRGDAFPILEDLARDGRRFDVVVVDPPSFAHDDAGIGTALRAYSRLTELAVAVVEDGGLLVQASCSSRVDTEDFVDAVEHGADRAGVRLQIEQQTGHAPDHVIGFQHGAYLKAVFAHVHHDGRRRR